MDWLRGMNQVIDYIEENLTEQIHYESLARIVGCSVYEFSRIFSFMAGMSVSEYIRRRRLSQAIFDIQTGKEKIIDIALKYCYESPTAFTRAFKELHGNGGGANNYYTAPLWQVAAYSFQADNGKAKAIIGAEYKGQEVKDMSVETIPAATWAVFSITSPTGIDYVPAAYSQIMTEWFPTSQYKRNESVPSLEVFPAGNANAMDYTWEIWIPVRIFL